MSQSLFIKPLLGNESSFSGFFGVFVMKIYFPNPAEWGNLLISLIIGGLISVGIFMNGVANATGSFPPESFLLLLCLISWALMFAVNSLLRAPFWLQHCNCAIITFLVGLFMTESLFKFSIEMLYLYALVYGSAFFLFGLAWLAMPKQSLS